MDVLLNWLGQGGVVALAAAAVLRATPRSRTQARYAIAWAASVIVLALPAAPLMIPTFPAPPLDATAGSLGPVVSMPMAWWTSPALAIGLWIIWCGVSTFRLAAAAVALRAIKRQCRVCSPGLQARLVSWSRVRTTGRHTSLVVSTAVRSAAVLGGGAPMIALAPQVVEQLSDEDLDRVVMHEWAHVQRYDDVAQIAQLIVRTVAGWHPALWWLQRQVDFEREVACDEIAVAWTGSAKEYGACLATLAALRLAPVRSLPVLAALPSSGLRQRLVRVLALEGGAGRRSWRGTAVAGSVALALLALGVGNVYVVEVATALALSASALPVIASTGAAAAASPAVAPVVLTAPAVSAVSPRVRSSVVRRARRENERSGMVGMTLALNPSRARSVATLPSQPVGWPLDLPAATQAGVGRAEQFLDAATEARSAPPAAVSAPQAEVDEAPRRPWMAAADAAVAIGRGSQNAGVATAGFFARFGKRIAGSF